MLVVCCLSRACITPPEPGWVEREPCVLGCILLEWSFSHTQLWRKEKMCFMAQMPQGFAVFTKIRFF